MTQDLYELNFSELLMARLCHELVSPVGAILNGVEILEEEPDFVQDAARLIGQSARDAAHRLQFYRVAYGSVGDVSDDRARTVATEYFAEGKIACDWAADLQLPAGTQKLACNLLLAAAEALPRGGSIKLVAAGEADMLMCVAASGTGARLPVPEILLGRAPAEDLTTKTVQSAFTAALARRLGARIEAESGPSGIELKVRRG